MVPSWMFNAKWLVVSSLLLILMLGACDGDSDTSVPQATATSVPVATVAAATSAPQVAAPKQGGELRIGMTAADIPLTDIQRVVVLGGIEVPYEL